MPEVTLKTTSQLKPNLKFIRAHFPEFIITLIHETNDKDSAKSIKKLQLK